MPSTVQILSNNPFYLAIKYILYDTPLLHHLSNIHHVDPLFGGVGVAIPPNPPFLKLCNKEKTYRNRIEKERKGDLTYIII